MTKLYVGIDVAKDKFDVSYTVDGQNFFEYSTFTNDKKGIKKFFKQAESCMQKQEQEVIHFCMEATGIYHFELCEYLQNSAHTVSVVNPLKTKSFSKSLMLRTKNDKVAWVILSEFKFEDIESISPKAMVAHAGLSPREHSSGSRVRGIEHISRMGNSNLRKILFFPALGSIKNPNYFTGFYLNLIEKGKPKKLAVTAVMRKILLTSMGVFKNQQPFDPNWAEKIRTKYLENLKMA